MLSVEVMRIVRVIGIRLGVGLRALSRTRKSLQVEAASIAA